MNVERPGQARYPTPIPVRGRNGHTDAVMTHRVGVGGRAPFIAGVATLLALLLTLPPATAVGAGWTTLKRVTDVRGSRLDSLHQLSAERGTFHLVHPDIGPNDADDRVLYQRSDDGGAGWTDPATLFLAAPGRRHVVPNLALATGGQTRRRGVARPGARRAQPVRPRQPRWWRLLPQARGPLLDPAEAMASACPP